MLIGFGHRSRVGKDTACKYLKENHGFHHFSFAYELKTIAHNIYGYLGVQPPEYYEDNPEARAEIITEIGKTAVDVWVHMNHLREIHPDIFVQHMFRDITRKGLHVYKDNICISDVRQINEVESIRKLCGHVVKINAPDVKALKCAAIDDKLEGFTDWDYELNNDSDLSTFHANIEAMYDSFRA